MVEMLDSAGLSLFHRLHDLCLDRLLHGWVNLEFLHWEALDNLAGWFGLEHTRLLGEWIDTLAGSSSWLLLQFHVEEATLNLQFFSSSAAASSM